MSDSADIIKETNLILFFNPVEELGHIIGAFIVFLLLSLLGRPISLTEIFKKRNISNRPDTLIVDIILLK